MPSRGRFYLFAFSDDLLSYPESVYTRRLVLNVVCDIKRFANNEPFRLNRIPHSSPLPFFKFRVPCVPLPSFGSPFVYLWRENTAGNNTVALRLVEYVLGPHRIRPLPSHCRSSQIFYSVRIFF